MTANAFMSVSLQPPLVLISVDKRAKMNALLHEGVRFGVNVLADDQRELSDHFAGRAADRAPEARFTLIHDTPLIDGALAHLVARAERSYWGGDHSLFLGRVEYARYGTGTPLLFHGGQYEQLLVRAQVFSTLSPELLEPILASGEERSFGEGEAIVRQGEPGDDLYVILEGRVRVERGGRPVESLGEGEFFGEVAVLDGRPRSADVVAEIPHEDPQALARGRPRCAGAGAARRVGDAPGAGVAPARRLSQSSRSGRSASHDVRPPVSSHITGKKDSSRDRSPRRR